MVLPPIAAFSLGKGKTALIEPSCPFQIYSSLGIVGGIRIAAILGVVVGYGIVFHHVYVTVRRRAVRSIACHVASALARGSSGGSADSCARGHAYRTADGTNGPSGNGAARAARLATYLVAR